MMTQAPFSVQCPSCEAWFPVDPERVPDEGVSAICSHCMRVFRVERPAGTELPEPVVEERHHVEPELERIEPEPPDEVFAETEDVDRDEIEPADVDEFEPSDVDEFVPPAPSEAAQVEVEPAAGDDDVGVEVEEEPPLDEEREEPPAVEDEGEESTGAPEDHEDSPVLEQSLSKAASRFGRRDPHDRAKRLARVLVSDMLTYHPARYEEAVAQGTLREQFDEEIRLSWAEYEDQVGRDLAESTDYFVRALNEILARGEKLWTGMGRPE